MLFSAQPNVNNAVEAGGLQFQTSGPLAVNGRDKTSLKSNRLSFEAFV